MKTSEEFREIARELQEAVDVLRPKLGKSHENLVTVIVGAVCAKMYAGFAHLLEMQTITQRPPSGARAAAEKLVQQNQQMRKAVLNGDWERFAQIVDGGAEPGDGSDAVAGQPGDSG